VSGMSISVETKSRRLMRSDRYRNRIVAVVDPAPSSFDGGLTYFVYGGKRYTLMGYRLMDLDEPAPVESELARARALLGKPLRGRSGGYELGHDFVLVVERRGPDDASIWTYAASNGAW
jgi:hypothetical protein